MKKQKLFLCLRTFVLLCLVVSISSLHAQNTERDFWLTFGQISNFSYTQVNLQIRIVNGDKPATGTLYFTNLGTSVPFNLLPQEVFTHPLDNNQKQAVYNTTPGKSNKSIHINSSEAIKVYALSQVSSAADATNVLPVEVLDNNYYQISYPPFPASMSDAYVVVAVNNNTQLYYNGIQIPSITLNAGDVYYSTSSTDMTGNQITANNPIAFFAVNKSARVPINFDAADNLFQQLAPVLTWGKNFFVPVSHLAKDRVRIVASQNNTTIQRIGGTHIYAPGGQTGTTYTINAGQYIELEALLSNNGCFIQANKSVGVCTYLTGAAYTGLGISDPSQAWLPAIEQMGKSALIAPFIPTGNTWITQHRAIIITPLATKDNTKVSIGGGVPAALSGGDWYDNLTITPQMSFYIMPLNNATASYHYTNSKGLIVMCYGHGYGESYYYLAGSAMRDLEAAFYANDVHFQDLKDNPFCAGEVTFRAEIEGLHPSAGSLKWYINNVEKLSAADQLTWSETFTPGEYAIKMWVRFENNDTVSKTGSLKIKACDYNAAFFANNVHHLNLIDTTFCNKDVVFRAEIEGLHPDPGSVMWYIDGTEYAPARDLLQWSKPFESGVYQIKMVVRYDNDETATISGTLKMDVLWIKIRNVRY
jgi:hypothetical protein